MEKAIEIKRRAQRCVQNGDLDGALREYEKLVETPESDPYNFVLLADLLFKKGDQPRAAGRYLNAVAAYEKAGLYKNGIAVCKKMMRLALSQAQVLRHLAELHALDGLTSEASIYFSQYAEHMLRGNQPAEACAALRKAFENGQENVRLLEQIADVYFSQDDKRKAAEAMREAAGHWRTRRQETEARRCLERAGQLDPAGGVPAATTEPDEAMPHLNLSRSGTNLLPPKPSTARLEPAPGRAPEPGLIEHSPWFTAPAQVEAIEVTSNLEDELATPEAGVYEIASEDYENALNLVETSVRIPVFPPEAPAPAVAGMPPHPPAPRSGNAESVTLVENLLQNAQDLFRSGDREQASKALIDAALTYERLGRLDSAATIFRSLGRGAQSAVEVMQLWLVNCERRNDRAEGALVACELGDRALNEGQVPQARAWFEHAVAIDPTNGTARRRLQRLASANGQDPGPDAPVPETAPTGRVAVALGRGKAVTFDLAGLLQEFQRGVESQLDGDAQGHYDLGMAYREMGLTAQAIDAFKISARDRGLAARSREMIGRCHADRGDHADALPEFTAALTAPGLDAAGEAELRFQLAQSLAALGETAAAVQQLELAQRRQPGRSDVAERLAEWRRSFGQAA